MNEDRSSFFEIAFVALFVLTGIYWLVAYNRKIVGTITAKNHVAAHQEKRNDLQLLWAGDGCFVPIQSTKIVEVPDSWTVEVMGNSHKDKVEVTKRYYDSIQIGQQFE